MRTPGSAPGSKRPTVSRALLVAGSVVALDALTKIILVTPPWAFHPQSREWQLTALAAALAVGLMMLYPRTAIPAALLSAGVAANLLDSIWDGGVVSNPFILITVGNGPVAFNLADVSLYAGAVAMVAVTPWLARDMRGIWRRRVALRGSA